MFFDIRYAFRQITKSPGFTAVAVATLALGIGVNTTMFSVLNALVLAASPARDPGRIVAIFRTSQHAEEWPQSPANYADYASQQKSFSDLAGMYPINYNLAEPGLPAERLAGMALTGSAFRVFGIGPELGRTFGSEYDRAGKEGVAVLSDRYWRGHFNADPAIIGRTVRMDGQPVTIIGVMPGSFENPTYWGRIDVWRPLAMDNGGWALRNNYFIQTVGRLRPDVTLEQAQAEAAAVAARLAHDFPAANAGNGLRLVPWDKARTGEVSRNISWLCMMLAGFVLLIACANLANLQLARTSARVREYAVRIALGASRLQLVRQLLVESLILSAASAVIGVFIAVWGTRAISSGIYITGVRGLDMPVNMPVLIFTLVASAAAGVAAGTIPALIASRADVNAALKQGSRGSTSDPSRHLIRKVLIVSELAMALILLSGAAYFVRGMQRLAKADLGWNPDGLVVASMSLPFNAAYSSVAQCQAFFDRLDSRLAALPGVRQRTIAAYLPIVGFWRTQRIKVQGKAPPPAGKEPIAYPNSVTPGHFDTLGIKLLAGRDFTSADRSDSRRVAIIDESMARTLFPGENPIGKRMAAAGASSDWAEIIGVAADEHPALEIIRRPDTPFQYYLPLSQTDSDYIKYFNVAVRSTAPVADVAAAMRAAVQQIDPDEPVYAITSAREAIEQQVMAGFTLTGKILAAFSLIGLALSAVGIYGVISYLAAQRTPEIGIRMALGAQQGDVRWMILGQGIRLAVAGGAIGLACSWGLVRMLSAVIPYFPGEDYLAVGAVGALLSGIAILASWIPAWRAARLDPVIALRSE